MEQMLQNKRDYSLNNMNSNSNIIYLTEDGFSEPIGTFDKITRVANVLTSLTNATLVIKISDVCVDGNGNEISNDSQIAIVIENLLHNVKVTNFKINSNSQYSSNGISINNHCFNINIYGCYFNNNNQGITISTSNTVKLISNEFNNCFFSIVFNFKCLHGYVAYNLFNNSPATITIVELNTDIQIVKNIFTNSILVDFVRAIKIQDINSNILIEDNAIYFEGLVLPEVNDSINSIYNIDINGANNQNIFINKNKFTFYNNDFSYKNNSIFLAIYLIAVMNDGSITIANNIISFENNKFLFNVTDSIALDINSISISQSDNINIYNNIITLDDNEFNFYQSSKYELDITSISLYNECVTSNILENEMFMSNNILKNIKFDEKVNSSFIGIYEDNIKSCISKNRFKLYNNYIEDLIIIDIGKDNKNINIIENSFYSCFSPCIYIFINVDNTNLAGLISYNRIYNVDTGIVLNKDNYLYKINNNVFYNCKEEAIKFVNNNLSNSINCNTICCSNVGIFFEQKYNDENEIVNNNFCWNNSDLVNVSKDTNFLICNTCDGKPCDF